MTPTEFKARFDEFSAINDAKVQLFINDAAPFFDIERWGDHYTLGLANYVAHELVMDQFRRSANLNASKLSNDIDTKKVGDVMVKRDANMIMMQAKDPFMRTPYGQEYKRRARIVGMGAVTV